MQVDFSPIAPKVKRSYTRSSTRSSRSSYVIDTLPTLTPLYAKFCFLLNLILPGSGTIASKVSYFHAKEAIIETNLISTGFSQFLCAFLLVGWVWSILWGCNLVAISQQYDRKVSRIRHARLLKEFNDLEMALIPEEGDLNIAIPLDDSVRTEKLGL